MDPEDLREVIAAYQKCVAETVQRFGGFVAKYMGDGVLVYFGYPQAHEDDTERAVRAGLELMRRSVCGENQRRQLLPDPELDADHVTGAALAISRPSRREAVVYHVIALDAPSVSMHPGRLVRVFFQGLLVRQYCSLMAFR